MTRATSNQLDPNLVRRFADGECTPAENLGVLECMAAAPAVTRQVIEEQRLRAAVGRAMSAPAAVEAAPGDLRAKLEAAMLSPETTKSFKPPAVIARIGRWAPLAVAAMVVIGSMVTLLEFGRTATVAPGSPVAIVPAGTGILPAERVTRFSQRHVRCSAELSTLFRTDEFPKDVQALPKAVADHVGRPLSCRLDLTQAGYRYDIAGVCTIPGQGAVHILYTAAPETGSHDRISLWVRPRDEATPAMEEGRVYIAADAATSPHPMLVWREGDLVFYLMGDAGERVQKAAAALRGDSANG